MFDVFGRSRGLKLMAVALILLALEGPYFLFFLFRELGWRAFLGNWPGWLWHKYFFGDVGGPVLILSILCAAIGWILVLLEQRRCGSR